MAAVLVDVADAITSALNGNSFSMAFTAERSWPDWDEVLEDAGKLKVDVVPVNHDEQLSALSDRATFDYFAVVDIGVRKKFGPEDQSFATGRIETSRVDELVLLLEEIHEFLIHDNLASYTSADWESSTIRVAAARDLLREHKQYLGIVRVTYHVDKAI